MSTPNEQSIGGISNYYGGLSVKTEDGKYYWGIENYDGHDWQEIPESLYRNLVEYENARQSPNDLSSATAEQKPQNVTEPPSAVRCSAWLGVTVNSTNS